MNTVASMGELHWQHSFCSPRTRGISHNLWMNSARASPVQKLSVLLPGTGLQILLGARGGPSGPWSSARDRTRNPSPEKALSGNRKTWTVMQTLLKICSFALRYFYVDVDASMAAWRNSTVLAVDVARQRGAMLP